jgi:hypothetical protein
MNDTQSAWWLVDDESFVIAGPYDTETEASEGNRDLHAGRLEVGYGRRGENGFLDAATRPTQETLT